ncbi:MAG: hypothetical protein ACOH2E_07530, partial [Candidatus Paracaedibacter sp.]
INYFSLSLNALLKVTGSEQPTYEMFGLLITSRGIFARKSFEEYSFTGIRTSPLKLPLHRVALRA